MIYYIFLTSTTTILLKVDSEDELEEVVKRARAGDWPKCFVSTQPQIFTKIPSKKEMYFK